MPYNNSFVYFNVTFRCNDKRMSTWFEGMFFFWICGWKQTSVTCSGLLTFLDDAIWQSVCGAQVENRRGWGLHEIWLANDLNCRKMNFIAELTNIGLFKCSSNWNAVIFCMILKTFSYLQYECRQKFVCPYTRVFIVSMCTINVESQALRPAEYWKLQQAVFAKEMLLTGTVKNKHECVYFGNFGSNMKICWRW